MNPLDLEQHLANVSIEAATVHMAGRRHSTFKLELAGGGVALAKPEQTAPEGLVMVHREVAAWRVAKGLDWHELVPPTVLRTTDRIPPGEEQPTAVQEFFEEFAFVGDPAGFTESEQWMAAIFDALVGASDRNMNNWLAVPDVGGRLKLVDHGDAFQGSPGSTFYDAKKGQRVPPALLEDVRRFLGEAHDQLRDLLDDAAIGALSTRGQRIVDAGVLDLS